ncbi:MAG: hypothetical protein K0U80_06795 [Actinomycetia bacterium]|nr:hypothetical protein [Actinomycetes bacterium]
MQGTPGSAAQEFAAPGSGDQVGENDDVDISGPPPRLRPMGAERDTTDGSNPVVG